MLAFVAAVAIMVCALGRAHPALLDPIEQAAPCLLLLAIGALLLLLRRGRWRRIAAIGLALTAIWLAVLLFSPSPWSAPEPGARKFRIVEWNVWLENHSPDGAARWLLAQDADVIILLEAANRGAAIAQALAPTFPYRTTCRLEGRCSTIILSRVAPVQRAGLAHGDADNRRALSAAFVRFAEPVCGCAIVALHLSHPGPSGAQRREIDELAAQMAGLPHDGLIVAGDFNAMPWSNAVAWVEQGLAVRRAGGLLPTWPARPAGMAMPTLLPIDHVLLGSGWSAVRVARGAAIGSDHYPLVIDAVASGADGAH